MDIKRSAYLVAVPLLLLTLAASPVAASTYYRASFVIVVKGPCVMAYNPVMVSPGQTTWEYFESAIGNSIFHGNAWTTEYGYGIHLYQTVNGTVNARGWLKTSWSHGGDAYEFQASIYSLSDTLKTYALFDPDLDVIILGGSPDPNMALGFTGVLKKNSVTEHVQGTLGFMLMPLTGTSGETVTVTIFHFDSLIDNKAVEFWWAESGVHLSGDSLPTINIPAAKVFAHKVNLAPP